MPEQKFAFKVGGPKRLVLRSSLWGGQQDIYVDDRLIGSPTRGELAQGWRKSAAKGGELFVRRVMGGWDIRVNGQPIADSHSHPFRRARLASEVNFAISAITVGYALLVAWVTRLTATGEWFTIVYLLLAALIYGVLGWFIRARQSALALGITIVLYLGDTVFVLLTTLATLNPVATIGAFMVRFVLFNQLIAGVGPLVENWRASRRGERVTPDYKLVHVIARMDNPQRTRFLLISLALTILGLIGVLFALPDFRPDVEPPPQIVTTPLATTTLAPTAAATQGPSPTLPPPSTLPPTWTPTLTPTQPGMTTHTPNRTLPPSSTLPPTWTPTITPA